MPTFGDFETTGEPFAVTDERTHVSTIWQARKAGSTGAPTFAVKCYAPHRISKEGQAEDALDKDRGLEFLEGIKQLKKAHSEGGRCLAPIHALGISSEGAWFVTDFYPGKTLREFIAKRGRVDGPALRHIIHSILTGCLALKRSRGFSHGNVKSTNVFLAGRPRPLRSRPFHLTDAYPAAPLKLGSLEGPDKRTVDDLLHKVMEAQDLRAIGELILQLAEGRIVSSSYDYNYPVARSAAWDQLGGEAERWRQLCNSLLDPQLALDSINLQTLEKQLRPSQLTAQLPKLAAATAICLVAGGIYLAVHNRSKGGPGRRDAQYETAYAEAAQAFAATNLVVAQRHIAAALKARPGDAKAGSLKTEIDQRIEQDYRAAMTAAQTALDEGQFPQALARASEALALKPQDAAATKLRHDGEAAQARSANAADTERKFNDALAAAQGALQGRNFSLALAKVEEALRLKPQDPAAAKLKQDAELEKQFSEALAAAQKAFQANDHAAALTKVGEALRLKPQDATAGKLKLDAEAAQGKAARVAMEEKQFNDALKSAQAAYKSTNYVLTLTKVGEALRLQPEDATALQLKKDATAAQEVALRKTSEENQFNVARDAAQEAYRNKDYPTALAKIEEALRFKPQDPTMKQLKLDATQRAAEDKVFNEALGAAQAAFKTTNYSLTLAKIDEALRLKPQDPAAIKLKQDVQAAMAELTRLAGVEKSFGESLAAAQAAFAAKDHATALTKVGQALLLKPQEPVAAKLKLEIEVAKAEADRLAALDKNFAAALGSAQAAFATNDYTTTLTKIDEALKLKPQEATALKLKRDAEAARSEATRRAEADRNFNAALLAAQNAFKTNDHTTALAKVNEALTLKPENGVAIKLKQDVEAAVQSEAANRAARDAQFGQAFSSAKDALTASDFTTALARIADALKLKPQDTAAQQLKLQIESAQAAAAKAATVEKQFGLAMTAAQNALNTNDFAAALASLNEAARLKPQDPGPGEMRKRVEAAQLKADADMAARHPPTALFGIDFVWVRGVGANRSGAYVASTELSWAQYAALAQRLSQTPKPVTEDDGMPAAFTSYSEAASFVDSLNSLASPTGQGSKKGLWRLPTLDDYKALTDSQVTVGTDGLWTLPQNVFDGLRDKENMAGSNLNQNKTGVRQKTALGPANSKGLRYVLGNVREWAATGADGARFGVSYLSEGQTVQSKALNSARTLPRELIGLRLVYQPAD